MRTDSPGWKPLPAIESVEKGVVELPVNDITGVAATAIPANGITESIDPSATPNAGFMNRMAVTFMNSGLYIQ